MKKGRPENTYILGLDIGMASVGGALLTNDQIIGLHVRTFNKAETAKEGKSLNEIRREARLARRRLRRRAFRLLRLRRLFRNNGLTNSINPDSFYIPDQTPWQLRTEGLDRQLRRKEWAAALYHLVKHRGFQSTRKSEAKEDEKTGQMLTGVNENSRLLQTEHYRTIGELAYRHPAFQTVKRNKGGKYSHTFSRADIETELRSLFEAQRKQGNPNASAQFEDAVHSLLMARRPALSGNALLEMVGRCTFEKTEYRAPKALYSAEQFVWRTKLNNLRISGIGQTRALDEGERNLISQEPFIHSKLTYRQVRKALNLGEAEKFVGLDYREKESKKDPESTTLFEAKAFHKLRREYEKSGLETFWQRDRLDAKRLDDLAFALTVFKEDEESVRWMKDRGIEKEVIDAVLNISFSGFIRLSRKALLKILPFMESGLRYDEAVEEAKYNSHSQFDRNGKSRYLPKISTEDVINPVVYRSLNQARKLVNAIVRHYGPPIAIHIELARDLNKPFDERKRIKREQENFRVAKEKDIKYFEEEFGHVPRGPDLIKFRLYREQNGQSAYSQKPLNLDRLLEDGYVEVDHALPRSRSFDNSMNNKVLVMTQENRDKGNMTPYEYLDGASDSDSWRRFVVWVIGNKGIRLAKRNRLLRKDFGKEEAEQFRERNLTDTRYACRYFKNHIEKHLQLAQGSDNKRCVVVSGQQTAFLRARWGLLKVREEGDKHHALDAAVVAACSHAFVKRLADYSRHKELEYCARQCFDPETGEIIDIAAIRRLEKDFPQPWDGFRKELVARLSDNPCAVLPHLEGVRPIRVSRAPQRRGAGAAHQDTIRSAKCLEDQISSVKTPLEKLRLKDLPNIVGYDDPRNKSLIDALRQRLEAHNDDGKRAFTHPVYKPSRAGKTAPVIRTVNLYRSTRQKSGLLVRKGIADNGDMLRVDIFTKNGKFFAVPIYVSDIARHDLPNKAISLGKHGWLEMDHTYDFHHSFYPNDWIRISLKNKPTVEGYYAGIDIATGAVNVWSHDRNRRVGSKNSPGLMRGIGIKTALSVEKHHVDMLGNLYRAGPEIRQPLKPAEKG